MRRLARNKELVSNIDLLFSSDEKFTVCDFGAADGSTLKEIQNTYKNATLIGIELNTLALKTEGITAYQSLQHAFASEEIDLLISSNSLLYTDYSELKSILQGSRKPTHLILTGPNHLSRTAQMFYDDVICNASFQGLKLMTEDFGYKQINRNSQDAVGNEITIICSVSSLNNTVSYQPVEPYDLANEKRNLLIFTIINILMKTNRNYLYIRDFNRQCDFKQFS